MSQPDPTTPDRTEQELARRANRDAIADSGVDPYPAAAFNRTTDAATIQATYDDEQHAPQDDQPGSYGVAIAGRIVAIRVMGKAAFLSIADESGRVQLYVRRDDLPEGYYNAVVKKRVDLGDFVGVSGWVFRTRTGEVSVHCETFTLLTKALRPLPVEKEVDGQVFNEITDKEFRYRQRYADLALHPDVRHVFKQRATIVSTIRRFLDEKGYTEVETPVLQPLYGGAAARPFTTHHNALDMPLFLRIADELYLKRLIVGGFEGVYEIAKDFRNEGLSRFHNPEFTMLEVYVAYQDYTWMMEMVEEMVQTVVQKLNGGTSVEVGEHTIEFGGSWRRLPFFQAIQDATGHDLMGKGRDEIEAAATLAPHRNRRVDGRGQAARRDLRRNRRAQPDPADVHYGLSGLASRRSPSATASTTDWSSASRPSSAARRSATPSANSTTPTTSAPASRSKTACAQPETTRPSRSTKITYAPWNTACRQQPEWAWASTAWP